MFVRTKRLTLRPGWIEDAPELARAIGQWDVVKNLSRAPWPYTLGHAEQFLSSERVASEGLMIVAPQDEGARIVGCVGLRPIAGSGWELGYWIVPDCHGRGYATEAAGGLIEFAREVLRLPQIEAGFHVENPASGRVLQKLGFEPTGERRMSPCLARGEPVETIRLRKVLKDEAAPGPCSIRIAA